MTSFVDDCSLYFSTLRLYMLNHLHNLHEEIQEERRYFCFQATGSKTGFLSAILTEVAALK